MRLIHTSDIHIDSPMTARLSASEARERKREIITSFRNTIEEARKAGAIAILIAGDLFDNDKVGCKMIDSVIGIMENARDVYFFYLPGNHEKDRIISSGISLPDNLKIFGEDWTYFKIDNLTIAGKSRITPNMFDTLTLYENDKNIVVLHGELDAGDESNKISSNEAARHPIDYLALGHYHSYSKKQISDRTVAVYSGTPEGRGFDETGEKGYVILDSDALCGIDHRFVKNSIRTLHAVDVNISGAFREIEIENRIMYAVQGISAKDIIRVYLKGEREPELKIDVDSLSSHFSTGFFYFEIKDETKIKISPDTYKNDRSLKGEFIRLVMSKDELSEEEKASIIECGIRALAGETI